MKIYKNIFCLTAAVLIFISLYGCTNDKNDENDSAFNEHSHYASVAVSDNTKSGWGFKKEKGKPPHIADETVNLFKESDAFYIGNTDEKVLYLTFDEGYENGYTSKILDVLKKTNTKAAFFVTGDYIRTQPELVKRMYNEGHIVGNHTNHHPSMPDKSDEEIKEEISSLNKMYNDLTGNNMKYLRPPMGEYSPRTLNATKKMGYKTVFWSFAYVDWKRDTTKGADYAYDQIMPYIHNGAVILLHAVSEDNADVLERLICDLKQEGYEFKSLDEI